MKDPRPAGPFEPALAHFFARLKRSKGKIQDVWRRRRKSNGLRRRWVTSRRDRVPHVTVRGVRAEPRQRHGDRGRPGPVGGVSSIVGFRRSGVRTPAAGAECVFFAARFFCCTVWCGRDKRADARRAVVEDVAAAAGICGERRVSATVCDLADNVVCFGLSRCRRPPCVVVCEDCAVTLFSSAIADRRDLCHFCVRLSSRVRPSSGLLLSAAFLLAFIP
ncbi:hypothetical protein HPB51_008811 [Rhipicephalus microplus]|uniref:Uncharacterized protein n=1 Tax=Rhipicephalus microplus TaxID=6941 RepID=A0A9J6ERW5_RHIMP|nr:hypothetical protein HPB51_008811 [Rhipicephalus microplus]